MSDLWPDDLVGSGSQQRAPVAILREQAAALGQRTQNIIEGRVESMPLSDSSRFYYQFVLLVRVLDRYRYELFNISHDVELYPVRVSFEEFPQGVREAQTEGEFAVILRQIFASDKTRKVINAILAQVEE